ncbi:MAG: beta-propeller domain-containing protein [Polyangiales bacterium]
MRRIRGVGVVATALSLAAVGCAGSPGEEGPGVEPGPAPGQVSFESDLPASSQGGGRFLEGDGLNAGPGVGGVATGGAPQAAPPTTPTAGEDEAGNAGTGGDKGAERAISEADIIQLNGDRLYALSRLSGLAVIDVSKPDALQLLGRYRELPAEPFEMYLHDGVALVMFNGWGEYQKVDEENYAWVSTSKLLALDVTNPAAITQVGSFDIAGSISDSRMVGDNLYVVGHQSGSCWGCGEAQPRTSILSLQVADPRHVEKVDELFYGDDETNGWQKSIAVTNTRMYVAGPEYGNDGPKGSTIQVVDISRADGDLVEGTKVPVAGEINNRWQMDEYDGVLRVVSQPSQWWGGNGSGIVKPVVETFAIASSDTITKLGRTEITLPERETLRSVRFDGERGYAITAVQVDPLFTIDLSDPANPAVRGELKMPGFVYHMEPRGERLIGLGYDQGNPEGGITVSLFDVSNLATPTMLSRVNFGGDWGQLPADQDRIHKVFRVLDDSGLILVPFSGWQNASREAANNPRANCGDYGESVGGVQLIDFANDTLGLRGAAPSDHDARRALLVKDRLLSVSDQRVQTFDITDRSAPTQTSQVMLARQTYRALQLDNGVVARLSYESKGSATLDFTTSANASDPNAGSTELDVHAIVADGGERCEYAISIDETFVHGSQLELLYTSWGNGSDGTGKQLRGLLVIDASDATQPSVVANVHWENNGGWSTYYGYYHYGYYGNTRSTVRTDSALVSLETSWESSVTGSVETQQLRVVDLRDLSNVQVHTQAVAAHSNSGLLVDGDLVLTSHLEQDGANKARARFYIDRYDVSDPASVRELAKVNVPGALAHFDASSGRALTTEQLRREVPNLTAEECYKRFSHAEWSISSGNGSSSVASPPVRSAGSSSSMGASGELPQPPPERALCVGYLQRFNLVRLDGDVATLEDSFTLAEDQQTYALSAGDGVVFANLGRSYYYGGYPTIGVADVACAGYCGGPTVQEPAELLVLGGFADGALATGRIMVEQGDDSWYGWYGQPSVYAYGQNALVVGRSDAAFVDASDPSAPTIAKRVPLIASPQYVDVRDKTALLTLGAQGVQWLSLD